MELHFGWQKGSLIFRFKTREIRISQTEIFCLLAGILIFGAAKASRSAEVSQLRYVERREYGQEEEKTSVLVEGLDEEAVLLEFLVAGRQYTDSGAEAAMDDLESRLERMILGDNPDLSHVRSRLFLETSDEATGLTIRWSSDSPEVVDSQGYVNGENTDRKNGTCVELQAEIRDGQGRSRQVTLLAKVYPPILSAEEETKTALLDQIRHEEEDTRTEAGFYLPQEYKGVHLTYRDPEEGSLVWIPVLGLAAALFCRIREGKREKEKKKERDRLLLLDYSELVSRLQIFLGAGMTVYTALGKITEDYLECRRQGGQERPAYEELARACSQIKSGTPESRAYEEFGRRCGLPSYLKLSGLLEQNRKTGGKNLRHLLKLEVADAFEQRKNLARRQGEEASAKLLLPLFMMLGIVMVIVAVPAFLSFS